LHIAIATRPTRHCRTTVTGGVSGPIRKRGLTKTSQCDEGSIMPCVWVSNDIGSIASY